jgi:hypothetical protein
MFFSGVQHSSKCIEGRFSILKKLSGENSFDMTKEVKVRGCKVWWIYKMRCILHIVLLQQRQLSFGCLWAVVAPRELSRWIRWIRWIRWLWHMEHTVFFEPMCRSRPCVNWAVVDMNHVLFLMPCPSSRNDCLFKWIEYICYKVLAIQFGIILELVNNIEVARVPHDAKYEFFVLDVGSRLCDHVISHESLHATLWCTQKDYDSSPITGQHRPSFSEACKKNNIAVAYFFRFSHNLSVNTCETKYK